MANIKPLGSLILIKEVTVDEKTTKSGLVIAATTVDMSLKRGEVIEVGPGDNDNAGNHYDIPLQKGDIVIYSENHATEVEDTDREKYHFINWRTLFGTEIK
jgi:co-chaperonin GroES (HSP10)